MNETPSSVRQGTTYAGVSPFKGFWIRFVAAIFDAVILSILVWGIALVLAIITGVLMGDEAGIATLFLTLISLSIALILYKPLMEASEYQGTLGKYVLGMKIVNQRGERITMKDSFIRSIVYMILGSVFVGILGLIMIGFTEQKQGLHDIAAKTFVVSQHWSGPIPGPHDGFGA